jgi:membrane associated rhomboid family serine protease
MSETELRVICKSCRTEVSPYVTECPYCGARVRKRAPKLERRDGGLEAKKTRKQLRGERRAERKARRRERSASIRGRAGAGRLGSVAAPATALLVLAPAVAMLVRIASGGDIGGFGAVVIPGEEQWWRFLTAPFAYADVGYLFAVGLALVIFAPGIERSAGSVATLLLLVACGSFGALIGWMVEDQTTSFAVIAGGNGMALGAVAAWWMIRRRETAETDEEPDSIGVIVSAAVILLLPLVVESASFWAAPAGGAFGLLAGLTASVARR